MIARSYPPAGASRVPPDGRALTPAGRRPDAGRTQTGATLVPRAVPWHDGAMSHHPTDFVGSIEEAVRTAVQAKLPDAVVDVSGGGGHWRIDVVSTEFAGKTMLHNQRLVLGAIKHLINGANAPIHAVDSLTTRTP